MQIHELNDFTGTLGSGAYLAIDDGNDTGKISSQDLLAATEARIDNIIAGPAPSAEEIVDARLGADGVTYPSLGDAIRDQFTDVKSDLIGAVSDGIIATATTYRATISSSNVWSINNNGSNLCVAIPVKGGEKLELTHRSGITFHMAFLKSWTTPVNNATPDFCTGNTSRIVVAAGTIDSTYTVPSDCRYIYILVLNNYTDYSPLHFVLDGYDVAIDIITALTNYIESDIDIVRNDVVQIERLIDGEYAVASPTTITGYVNHNTGGISTYGGGTFVRTDYIDLGDYANVIKSNFVSNADAGCAFYNSSKEYISGGTAYPINVPDGAKYAILSDYKSDSDHSGIEYTIVYQSINSKLVSCYGDSVTEGMGMTSIGKAEYGGDNYPSHLLKLLKDNGYNAIVANYGHSGERSTEICARVGGRVCGYLGEDVTIPSNNAAQSLGVAVVTNYKVTGSKLYSTGKNADGTTAQLLFTKLGHDTRPLMVGDRLCNIYQANQDGGMIQTMNLVTAAGEEVTIPALSVLTTGNSKRNADVNVVYMGVNDGTNLTLDEWIDRCNSIIERNPKTLILGATNHNWTFWTGMTGTDAEKRATYLNACLANFGSYYLDLYDILTTKKGIDIALAGGYLSGRTAEQITADNNAIANRQTPPSLTLEGTAGEVHLNTIGYYVLAKVVYDKINQLGLL